MCAAHWDDNCRVVSIAQRICPNIINSDSICLVSSWHKQLMTLSSLFYPTAITISPTPKQNLQECWQEMEPLRNPGKAMKHICAINQWFSCLFQKLYWFSTARVLGNMLQIELARPERNPRQLSQTQPNLTIQYFPGFPILWISWTAHNWKLQSFFDISCWINSEHT